MDRLGNETPVAGALRAIERQADRYAGAREALQARVAQLQDEIAAARRTHAVAIRRLVAAAKSERDALRALVAQSPDAFERPRKRSFHGTIVGYERARGSVVLDDEARTIRLIRQLLPPEQAELLVRVRESVHRPAVYDLTAADLRRLGISIEGAGDAVVIRDALSEVDRLVEALLGADDGDAPEEQRS